MAGLRDFLETQAQNRKWEMPERHQDFLVDTSPNDVADSVVSLYPGGDIDALIIKELLNDSFRNTNVTELFAIREHMTRAYHHNVFRYIYGPLFQIRALVVGYEDIEQTHVLPLGDTKVTTEALSKLGHTVVNMNPNIEIIKKPETIIDPKDPSTLPYYNHLVLIRQLLEDATPETAPGFVKYCPDFPTTGCYFASRAVTKLLGDEYPIESRVGRLGLFATFYCYNYDREHDIQFCIVMDLDDRQKIFSAKNMWGPFFKSSLLNGYTSKHVLPNLDEHLTPIYNQYGEIMNQASPSDILST